MNLSDYNNLSPEVIWFYRGGMFACLAIVLLVWIKYNILLRAKK